ncbi:MAG: hypothetical protein LBH87_03240 [Coriobacteriales bacterium]|jgi:hypothetical protein|nr:hypothetical protein [Coriobacteriales bacterium]
MDIERLTEEVIRRLLERIRQEEAYKIEEAIGQVKACMTEVAASEAPQTVGESPCCCPTVGNVVATGSSDTAGSSAEASSKKQLITEEKARQVPAGSKVIYPKGSIITPLAKDMFKERGVCFELEQ